MVKNRVEKYGEQSVAGADIPEQDTTEKD